MMHAITPVEERRSTLRIPFRGYVNKVQNGMANICRGVDLSSEGIGLSKMSGPQSYHNDVVSLEFQLPNQEEVLIARGRMVRKGTGGYGIRFTNISNRHRNMIDGYIAAARLSFATDYRPIFTH